MSDTFFRKQINTDAASFLLLTTPFFPKITRKASEGDEPSNEFDIVFNEAYVFDYANGGKKHKVTKREHTVNAETRYRFWLKITVDAQAGSIYSAEIVKKDGETPADSESDDPSVLKSTLTNFVDYSMISPPSTPDPAYFAIEILEFDKGELKELYLRENIHFHHKGAQQRSNGFDNSFGVLVPGASSQSMFNCIRKDPRYDNKIEISQDGNDILFYVKGDSASQSA